MFHRHLNHLEESFPSQSPMLWNVIGGAVYSHIQDPPMLERPVVLLLAGLPNSESTTRCLATQLGSMFYDIFQSTKEPVLVFGKEYRDASGDEAKIKIDESLRSGLQTGSHCGIIHNLDDIPPCAILIFHSYCENDNAPFKDVAIVHTIQLKEGADVLGKLERPKDYERVVSKYLRSVWEPCPDLTEDKQSAMLSRVANNVAVVKEESESQLRKVCS
ncbi:torsin-1A-interacting protein 1-like [Amphiura filiformis]|uniref:torsin-1A-interacting protein 1-like n=1 Tax=Amphiura filiformis TaxID=82378 RepID=UPI003B2124B0